MLHFCETALMWQVGTVIQMVFTFFKLSAGIFRPGLFHVLPYDTKTVGYFVENFVIVGFNVVSGTSSVKERSYVQHALAV